jgi:hypothetical protein
MSVYVGLACTAWQRWTWGAMKPVLKRAVGCDLVFFALALLAAQAQSPQPDLTDLRIEDLMNVNVTSASKKEQKISRVPAAIFVIPSLVRRSAYGRLTWRF